MPWFLVHSSVAFFSIILFFVFLNTHKSWPRRRQNFHLREIRKYCFSFRTRRSAWCCLLLLYTQNTQYIYTYTYFLISIFNIIIFFVLLFHHHRHDTLFFCVYLIIGASCCSLFLCFVVVAIAIIVFYLVKVLKGF